MSHGMKSKNGALQCRYVHCFGDSIDFLVAQKFKELRVFKTVLLEELKACIVLGDCRVLAAPPYFSIVFVSELQDAQLASQKKAEDAVAQAIALASPPSLAAAAASPAAAGSAASAAPAADPPLERASTRPAPSAQELEDKKRRIEIRANLELVDRLVRQSCSLLSCCHTRVISHSG